MIVPIPTIHFSGAKWLLVSGRVHQSEMVSCGHKMIFFTRGSAKPQSYSMVVRGVVIPKFHQKLNGTLPTDPGPSKLRSSC